MAIDWHENPEDRLIELLQYMEDELPHFFSGSSGPVKLRDWRSGFRIAKIWTPFAPQFSDLFFESLKQVSSLDAESKHETATRVALGRAIGKDTPFWVGDVDLEPLSEHPSAVSECPRDALFDVWLFGKPSDAEWAKADSSSGGKKSSPKKDGLETEEKPVGGRPGYVIRAPDFYETDWGQWLKNPRCAELMTFVEGLESHAVEDASAFARLLTAKGFTTSSGGKFDAASVRRLDVSRELLLGNSRPAS